MEQVDIRKLLEDIAKLFVESPEQIVVRESVGTSFTSFTIFTAPGEAHQLIGKEGVYIDAIGWIIHSCQTKYGRVFKIEVISRGPARSLKKAAGSP